MQIGTKFKFKRNYYFVNAMAGEENLIGQEFEITKISEDYEYCTNSAGVTYLLSGLSKEGAKMEML